MKKYAVVLNSLLIYVFSSPTSRDEAMSEITDGSIALFIHPSELWDMRIETHSLTKGIIIEPRAVLAALSFFLREVRSMPPMELDVEYNGEIYTVSTESPEYIIYDIRGAKCKEILSNIGLRICDVALSQIYRLIIVNDVEMVDLSWLLRARLLENHPLAYAVAAVSFGTEILLKTALPTALYELLAAVLSLYETKHAPKMGSIIFNGNKIAYRFSDDGRIVFPVVLKYLGALD